MEQLKRLVQQFQSSIQYYKDSKNAYNEQACRDEYRKKDDPMYLYDNQDMLIASGGTAGYIAITKKEDSPYEPEYIQAWLNHPFTDQYLQTIDSDFEGDFIARGTYTLPMVPFVSNDLETLVLGQMDFRG